MNSNLKIEIRPIPNRNNIRTFSDKLEYYSQAHIISPLVDPVRLKFITGLSKEDVEYLKENGFPYDLSDTYKRGEPHEFWESGIIKMELRNNPTFLYPGKSLIDFVKYKYLLQSIFVYSSETEMKTGSKPMATHYIYNEEEEMSVKSSKLEKRNKLIEAISKMSLSKKREVVLIINNEDTEHRNEEYLNVKLNEMVDNSDKSKELESLLKRKKEDVDAISVIRSAIRKNVIKRTRKGYFYFDSNLGLSEQDVIEFLTKKDNQEILFTIKSKIE